MDTSDNYLESFKIWCWRRTEKNIWTDRVRNEEVLRRIKEEKNILHIIDNILRINCLLKHLIEEKIEGWIEVKGG
jgi:hypothetical protein